jgi:signal transduction histidine kinase
MSSTAESAARSAPLTAATNGTAGTNARDGTAGAGQRVRPAALMYALLAVLFSLYLGINQLIGLRNEPIEPWKPLVWEMSSGLVVFFVLIPLVVRFESRHPIDAEPRWRAVCLHAAAALTFSAAHVVGMVLLRKAAYALLGQSYNFGNPAAGALYELQKDLITYAVILVVVYAYRQVKVRRSGEIRGARLAAELSQARLRHLTAQIEPHFLFNALNAISNRMHEDIEAADRMISDLGDLLRAAYDSSNDVLVPLGVELDLLRGYTAIMAERFRGQLTVNLDVPGGLETLQVPRLLLQPLVENALIHGLGNGHGNLSVVVRRQGAQLHYSISDDGAGISDSVNPGTGLTNVTRRLELLFPAAHTFDLRPRRPCGTVVTLSFPVAG